MRSPHAFSPRQAPLKIQDVDARRMMHAIRKNAEVTVARTDNVVSRCTLRLQYETEAPCNGSGTESYMKRDGSNPELEEASADVQ